MMISTQEHDGHVLPIKQIPLSYNSLESRASALRLVFTLFPEWEHAEGEVQFTRFTDGITNTLLKAVKLRSNSTEEQIDAEAVLLRAYGSGTEVLIDRDRELASHFLLSQQNLAPQLLARFQNGLMYRFIRGTVCTYEDLAREEIWRAVAHRLAEWHARLPITPESGLPIMGKTAAVESVKRVEGSREHSPSTSNFMFSPTVKTTNLASSEFAPENPTPNLWTVMQKWVLALPSNTPTQKARKESLQTELERIISELGSTPGLNGNGLVFGHCDLLSGNVIVHSPSSAKSLRETASKTTVSFIDYEYATPCPSAFDIANHFAEWGGFQCDYTALPTRTTRRKFLREYLHSYFSHVPFSPEESPEGSPKTSPSPSSSASPTSPPQIPQEATLDELEDWLFAQVDRFRGIPGFYWGIWALIQKEISQIDFDYGAYAELRLGEYWAWRRAAAGGGDNARETTAEKWLRREKRWAEE